MNPGVQLNAFDPNSLGDLKRLARTDGQSDETLRAAAKQFEAMFMQMVMKSMRAATPASPLTDNEQSKMYQSLLDQQLALNMSQAKGTGLSETIFRQLGGGRSTPVSGPNEDGSFPLDNVPRTASAAWARGVSPAQAKVDDPAGDAAPGVARMLADGALVPGQRDALSVSESAAMAAKLADAIRGAREAGGAASQRAREFVAEVWPHAVEASRKTGIPPQFMVAQAALETGWGEKQLRTASGAPTHNLFNIKAGSSWTGRVTTVATTEYAGGRPYTEQARFRAYGSYAESFADYARLLSTSPRYEAVLGQTDAAKFARGLQTAGYATDPMYADKLTRIIGGATLKSALATSG